MAATVFMDDEDEPRRTRDEGKAPEPNLKRGQVKPRHRATLAGGRLHIKPKKRKK